jgi:hypothetical protein
MTLQRRLLAAWLAVIVIGIGTIMAHRVWFYPAYMVRVLDYRIGFLNSDAAGYAAVRSFSANHLIVDGDFRRAELPSSLFIPEPALHTKSVLHIKSDGCT